MGQQEQSISGETGDDDDTDTYLVHKSLQVNSEPTHIGGLSNHAQRPACAVRCECREEHTRAKDGDSPAIILSYSSLNALRIPSPPLLRGPIL